MNTNPSNHQSTTPRAILAAIIGAVEPAARPALVAALVTFWHAVLALAADHTDELRKGAELASDAGDSIADGAFAACVAAWWRDSGLDVVDAASGAREPETVRWSADVARDALDALESHTRDAATGRGLAAELLARAAAEECAPLALAAAQVFAAVSPDDRAASTMTALAALHEQAATVLRKALSRDEGLDRATLESFADDARDIAATVVKAGEVLLVTAGREAR